MKRHILYLLLIAAAVFSSCKQKSFTEIEKEKMAGRIAGTTSLDVKYSVRGTETKAVKLNNRVQDVTVDVNVNDKNLVWNIESNREWCEVRKEAHKGPGSVTLHVTANEDSESRVTATLTFVAGDYRGFKFTVDQSGSIFLTSQPFCLSSVPESENKVTLTVFKIDGAVPAWDVESDEWISVAAGEGQDLGEQVIYPVTITAGDNSDGNTRYGKLRFVSDEPADTATICIAQIGGNNVDGYDAGGKLFFEAGKDAKLEFNIPAWSVSSVNFPNYMSWSLSTVDGQTDRMTLTAAEHLSDINESRLTKSSFKLTNSVETTIAVPDFEQACSPAYGILSPEGLQKFAAAVNAGESIEPWTKDDVITLLADIDMKSITGWPGIGNSEHPFTGTFDGAGHAVDNLANKSEIGFFSVCKDAVINKLTLGSGCNIYLSSEKVLEADYSLGAIVSHCTGACFLNGCSYDGFIEFGASVASGASPAINISGVVGSGDISTMIEGCSFRGKISLTSKGLTNVYVGGILGGGGASVQSCGCSGTVSAECTATSLIIGGILPVLDGSASSSTYSNSFSGSILLNSKAATTYVGGVYGAVGGTHMFDYSFDKSAVMGSIDVEDFPASSSASLMAGGFAGYVMPGSDISFKGLSSTTEIIINHATEATTADNLFAGCLLGGCSLSSPAQNLVFDHIKSNGSISLKYVSSLAVKVNREYLGGVAGYTNGPATVTSCVNESSLGDSFTADTRPNGSNSYCQCVGGIIASADAPSGKEVVFKNCENHRTVLSVHYNNRPYNYASGSRYVCNAQGGILGVFDYYASGHGCKLTMDNCSCSGTVQGYRGLTGGIVGYARNATVSNCTSSAKMRGEIMDGKNGQGNNSAYKGGIAGALDSSSIANSKATCDIYATSPGSELASPGGILSTSYDNVSISGCSYYGNISIKSSKPDEENAGGILAVGVATSSVSDCRFGGKVGTVNVTANNVDELAIGNKTGTASGITLWDGR